MRKSGFVVYSFLNLACLMCILLLSTAPARSQQYNSDSWTSKAHGTITIIPTIGQRNAMLMNTFSLFHKWEFTMALYTYNDDGDINTDDGHSASLYAKYMFYENKARTGGAAVKAGTGMFPGTINAEDRNDDAFKSYWVNFPCTIPFFDNKLSWDIMPGATVTRQYGPDGTTAVGFTYSTRLAYAPWDPRWGLVGEVFGTEGEVEALPEYKIGIRWEPSQYATFAFTYGQEFKGNKGAGFEFGIMLFTPPFARLGGIGQIFKRKPQTQQSDTEPKPVK